MPHIVEEPETPGATSPPTQTVIVRISATEGHRTTAVDEDEIAQQRAREAPTTVRFEEVKPHTAAEPAAQGAGTPSTQTEPTRIRAVEDSRERTKKGTPRISAPNTSR